jgi:23S rRNA (pseudouridine1915-N3)-methyltransferase
MKFTIWAIGKTDEKYLDEGIKKYLSRLKHYTNVDYEEIKAVKSGQTPEETLKREAEVILAKLKSDDTLILLDEQGQMFDSVGFAAYIERFQIQAHKNVVFLIGGAFGHHKTIRERSNQMISLSKMTFSHQMVRLFLAEQLYRAFTIIRNEKYHNV